jgi:ferrochelatase
VEELMSNAYPYDAVLMLSFGGPEGPEDVIPFLENVLRGKPVPRERLLEVAEHYYHFGGVSPINQQCREMLEALRTELSNANIDLPVYWGNRNWTPYLKDTMHEMREAGVRKVLTWVTSGFSCYSGCRQYRENIQDAIAELGVDDMEVHKIRVFYNHPDFIDVVAEHVGTAMQRVKDGRQPFVAFTAHSIPMSMADTSDYTRQLTESCRLVAEKLGLEESQYRLVYQSRSGRPQDPWLEPDILDFIDELHQRGGDALVISPIGFLSDHMEVLFDLDDEAAKRCEELKIRMARAETPGTHPRFVSMVRQLIEERLHGRSPQCVGLYPANHDVCPENCCPAPPRRPPGAGGRPGSGERPAGAEGSSGRPLQG